MVCAAPGPSSPRHVAKPARASSSRQLQAGEYDAVLCDLRMPGMSGIELHAHLIEQGQLMPTIFMSGEYLPHELAAIEAAGCVEFLNKPFGMNPLLSAVEKAFALISP